MTVKLKISDIQIEPAAAVRGAQLDQKKIAEYADAYSAHDALPPPVVYCDQATGYWLGDGLHRLRALSQLGQPQADCDVRDGTRADAEWYASGANVCHGLALTREQRSFSVALALAARPDVSDQMVADHCHCSRSLVRKVREKVQGGTGATLTERTGADGKIYKLPQRDKADPTPADPPTSAGYQPLFPTGPGAELAGKPKRQAAVPLAPEPDPLPAQIACRRCSECQGEEHHWIDDTDDAGMPLLVCKHCDATKPYFSEEEDDVPPTLEEEPAPAPREPVGAALPAAPVASVDEAAAVEPEPLPTAPPSWWRPGSSLPADPEHGRWRWIWREGKPVAVAQMPRPVDAPDYASEAATLRQRIDAATAALDEGDDLADSLEEAVQMVLRRMKSMAGTIDRLTVELEEARAAQPGPSVADTSTAIQVLTADAQTLAEQDALLDNMANDREVAVHLGLDLIVRAYQQRAQELRAKRRATTATPGEPAAPLTAPGMTPSLQALVLEYLAKEGPVSTTFVRARTGCTDKQLASLVKVGLVATTGKGKGTMYRVAP